MAFLEAQVAKLSELAIAFSKSNEAQLLEAIALAIGHSTYQGQEL